MNVKLKLVFPCFLVFLFLCIGVGFFGIKHANASYSNNGRGFLWTNNFGWISLNCVNDWDNNPNTEEDQCSGPGGKYGVDIIFEKDSEDNFLGPGELYGYGWSPYLGVICFGKTCDNFIGDPPDGGSSDIVFNLKDAVMIGDSAIALFHGARDGEAGWARALAHRNQGDNGGWIKFSGTNEQGADIRVGIGSEGGYAEIKGSAWQRNSNGSGIGWIYFGGGSKTALPPPFECEEHESCATVPIDDDCDASYTGKPDISPMTGRDCQDYECADKSFYSSSGNTFCGLLNKNIEKYLDEKGKFKENALSDEDCFDGLDNDLDAYIYNNGTLEKNKNDNGTLPIDCNDSDCYDITNPRNPAQKCVRSEWGYCTDNIDNDADGKKDCSDPDCANFPLCIPWCVCGEGDSATEVACRANEADLDSDGDGILDKQYVATEGIYRTCDNCKLVPNPYQDDINNNAIGDACDAFLETQQGSIYTSQISVAKPPKLSAGQLADKYTATYCILTSAQFAPFNAESEKCQIPQGQAVSEFRLRQYSDTIALLPSETQKTLLSYVDVIGLKKERYGAVSSLGDNAPLSDDFETALQNKNVRVIYYVGDLEINTGDITIPADRGPVTVLVEGNISFGANISYTDASALSLKQIASIAWVVIDSDPNDDSQGGDIIIDPNVEKLVGAMFASNTIKTGTGEIPLEVKGLMVARRFEFQREYKPISVGGDIKGAELIIYDGRSAINPPPGLSDFIKVLPTFRSVAPR